MNFSVLRPYAFIYGLGILVPALLFVFISYGKIKVGFASKNAMKKTGSDLKRINRCFLHRTFFRALSWIMVVTAYAGVSFGTSSVPVQKTGTAVSLVFDISHSMDARDSLNGKSRLNAASSYAMALVDRLDKECSISIVLAKGDGILGVPLTEDRETVGTALSALSSGLMSSAGSSIGSGVRAAIRSFPSQSAQASYIWVFTDGEETDGTLAAALSEAVKCGIPVTIIGFGSEKESEVLAGDGVTFVKTALRSDGIRKTIDSAKKKISIDKKLVDSTMLSYVEASKIGSANTIFSSMKGKISSGGLPSGADSYDGDERETIIMYELQPVDRSNLFVALAIVFFVSSFIFGELNILFGKTKKAAVVSAVFVSALFTGCSGKTSDMTRILSGRIAWNRGQYQDAVASFLDAENRSASDDDKVLEQYAVYGLASTYLMQNETEAARMRFAQLDDDVVNEKIKFSKIYNLGIISYTQGEFEDAVECFKRALLIDGSNVNAKVNLELASKELASKARQMEQEVTVEAEDSQENSLLEDAIYSIIREKEQKQWKNRQKREESSSLDY